MRQKVGRLEGSCLCPHCVITHSPLPTEMTLSALKHLCTQITSSMTLSSSLHTSLSTSTSRHACAHWARTTRATCQFCVGPACACVGCTALTHSGGSCGSQPSPACLAVTASCMCCVAAAESPPQAGAAGHCLLARQQPTFFSTCSQSSLHLQPPEFLSPPWSAEPWVLVTVMVGPPLPIGPAAAMAALAAISRIMVSACKVGAGTSVSR